MKRKINKWQVIFVWGNDWSCCNRKCFTFGIFKLINFPKEGEYITKKNYKGFLINKIYKPFEININF